MLKFVILLIIGLLVAYMIKNKVVIDFISFFRKGFKLLNNKYGCYCFTR